MEGGGGYGARLGEMMSRDGDNYWRRLHRDGLDDATNRQGGLGDTIDTYIT